LYRTPLERCEPLSARFSSEIYQKLELYQRTGSFKLRGATNKLQKLLQENPALREKGFVTASAGNHAIGLCYAARALELKVTIVVPETVSAAKLETLRRFPAELNIAPGNYDFAEAYARQLEREQGLIFVSAYNDPEIVAGGGTVGLEALADLPDADILLVPAGGGGLISGISLWAKTVNPDIKVFGIQSEASPTLHHSLKAGKLVEAPELPTLADGLAGNVESESITFAIIQNYVDDIFLVTENELAQAMRFYANELHLIVEGSGAVGLAAILSERLPLATVGKPKPKIIDFVTGRNVAASTLHKIIN